MSDGKDNPYDPNIDLLPHKELLKQQYDAMKDDPERKAHAEFVLGRIKALEKIVLISKEGAPMVEKKIVDKIDTMEREIEGVRERLDSIETAIEKKNV